VPDDGGNGGGDDQSDPERSVEAFLEGHDIGRLMMQQLTDLLQRWGDLLEALARRGVDPAPLLQALAQTLRDAADQFDPGGSGDP
jgi:hypothetical protein